jgi:heterodisulfide reductase subunit C
MAGGHAIVTFLADPDADDYSVWLCSSCWRCEQVCPADVNIHDLMMEQRRQEHAPAGYRQAYQAALSCGLALRVSQAELDEVRSDRGLERVRLPPAGLLRRLLAGE